MQSGKRASTRSINYAFLLGSGGTSSVWENGTYRASAAYRTGDIFRIAIERGVVKYYKNGALIYQSRVAPTYPLVAATSIIHLGGTISNVVIATSSSSSIAQNATTSLNQTRRY
jgi:hypothetical protein